MTKVHAGTRHGTGTVLLLAGIAAMGSLATQLVVPALPALAHELHAGADDAQLVVSLFLVGLGSGQLVVGPLIDRIGRKPVLLAGLALYCLASAAAAMALNFPLLVAARLFQALGGSAGVVTARVLVGDLFPAEEVAARQAMLMSVILISPALAPVIGGMLTEWLGWRTIFALLALAGMAGAALGWLALPVPHGVRAAETTARPGLGLLLRNRAFLTATASVAGGSATLYMFLGTAPFLLASGHGLGPRDVGLCLMLVATCSIAGTFMVGRLERRGDAMLTGALLNFTAALLLLMLSPLANIAAFIGPMMMLGLGSGIGGPAGIARVVRSQPGREGTATSLAGAMQMLGSALAASLLGRFAPVGPGLLGVAAIITTTIALAAALLARRGSGEPLKLQNSRLT